MSKPYLDIVVVALFPEIIQHALVYGVLKRALDSKKVRLNFLNYRDFATDKHQTIDDRPFGGGSGMVLKPDICLKALDSAKEICLHAPKTIALSPAGLKLNQKLLSELASPALEGSLDVRESQSLVIFCGRYEGFDQRFLDKHTDTCLSIGDFVMSGGEYPALCLLDALFRLIPGTISDHSLESESFNHNLLDHPQYTKPINFEGEHVPPVLLTGNHAKIDDWRREQALALTKRWRPDLLKPLEIEQ